MICSCPVCNRRIAASLPLFGTVQKCLGCGSRIRIPGEDGGTAELVEKWLDEPARAKPEPKQEVAVEKAATAWEPMVAATGATPAVALTGVPASAVPEAAPAPEPEYRRPSPSDPVAPPPRPSPVAPPPPPRPAAPPPQKSEPVASEPAAAATAALPVRDEDLGITRPVLGVHPLYRNLAALAGGVVIAGIVIAIIIVKIAAANRPKDDAGQAVALQFNDALAEADSGVHDSCTQFVQTVERWLDGQALEPVAIERLRDAAKHDAEEYAAKVGGMKGPDSDESRAFHKKALDLAAAYSDLTAVAFPEVVRRVGEGGSPGQADFDRVELLVALGDSKIQAAQKALVEAQQVFAKKYSIVLAPKE